MLVLGRKEGERIVVGRNMTITVVEIRGGRVRLGFECSDGTPVYREEAWQSMAAEGAPALPAAGAESPYFAECP